MEWELFRKIADDFTSHLFPITILFELHNEPLLDDRTFQFIKYIKKKNPRKKTVVVTNGTLIDRFSLSEIIESRIDSINVSLNAHSNETYEKLTSSKNYSKVKENILQLASDARLKQRLIVTFVENNLNKDELNEAEQYWSDKGIRTQVKHLENRAGILNNYEALKPSDGKSVDTFFKHNWHQIKKKGKAVIGCHHPFYKLNILFNGDVILCCHDWERTTVLGNMNSTSIQEVWNSREFNDIRKRILVNRMDKPSCCQKCSLYSG
jgi:radical SAM protein with 4Fe4S-binding SPASM domain